MGIGGSSAKASYAAGERRVELTITDLGGMGGLAAMAGWANMTVDRETDGQIEKVYKEGGRTLREQYRKDGSHGEFTVVLGNGVVLEADGEQVDMPSLEASSPASTSARIEALKRAAKPDAAMTLTELRYVVAVAREKHFGRAAEACFVSQPTLVGLDQEARGRARRAHLRARRQRGERRRRSARRSCARRRR